MWGDRPGKGVCVEVSLKLRCDERFTHAFTACGCVFKEITLVGSNNVISLSCVATVVFSVRLLHAIAFSK